jgi:endonuclease-8
MDQSVIGGIGNIYRAELLFRAAINPFQPGKSVQPKTLRALWKDAQALMQRGMVDRRIVTTQPAHRPHPKGRARSGEIHYVYHRAGLPCFLCKTKVRTQEFVGRNLFWCPTCQPAIK